VVATKTLKKQKPLDIMSAIKVARKSIPQSMGSKKNVKVPRVINVPKIGGFLPIVPILTALSALGSLVQQLQKQLSMREWLKKKWKRKNVTTGKLKVLL